MFLTTISPYLYGRSPFLAAAMTFAAVAGTAAERLEVTLAQDGLSRLAWAGTDLLRDGKPRVKKVVLEHEALDEKKLNAYSFDKQEGTHPKPGFDRAGQRLTYSYSWGSVSFDYAPAPDRLGLIVTVTNDSSFTIADFEILPLVLSFPAEPTKPEHAKWIETLPDNLGVVEATFGREKLLLCCETIVPLNFGLAWNGKREAVVMLSGGVPMLEPGGVAYPNLGLPRIAPDTSLAIAFSLRFSSTEACKYYVVEPANQKLLADRYDAFRKYHQPRPAWKDRRPIGTVFVGKGKGPESNPRNWFGKQDLDVRTPEGKAELRRLFMRYADQSIKTLKNVNAQGMIVWDPEGSENPHPVTYIGDPRMVKILAPEVKDIYPDFFKKFLAAGLRTGCCIRPTQVYFNDKDKKWSHGTGSHGPERNPLGDDFSSIWPSGLPWWRFYPVVERMCRKIEYARKNWGCTIFYVDTNGVFRQIGEKQEFKWALLDSHVWRDIMRRHPDVLLIPELTTRAPAQWAYTAQYLQPPYSSAVTPAYVTELLPGAFSVCQSVNLPPMEWDKLRGQFLEGIRRGDGMFFRGWFEDSYNAKIKQMYDEIYKPGAVAPDLPGAVSP